MLTEEAKAVIEAAETRKARDWLQDRGIVAKNVKGQERRQALQNYIKTLVKPKPGQDWAWSIIKAYEAGTYPHEVGYKLACDAVKHKPVEAEAF